MKVVRHNEVVPYEAKGHFDVRTSRVCNKDMCDADHLIMGISWFLPGGGAEYSKVGPGAELIYYIAEGEMTVTTDEGSFVLKKGDSVFFKEGDGRSVKNESSEPAAMLVVISK